MDRLRGKGEGLPVYADVNEVLVFASRCRCVWMWERAGDVTVPLGLMGYRSCRDTASGIVEIVEGGPDV